MDGKIVNLRLQKAIPMPIDRLNRISICNRNMIRLNPHHLAVLLMSSIDSEVASPTTSLIHEPEVGKLGREGRGNASDGICAEVGKEIVQDGNEEERPGREEG